MRRQPVRIERALEPGIEVAERSCRRPRCRARTAWRPRAAGGPRGHAARGSAPRCPPARARRPPASRSMTGCARVPGERRVRREAPGKAGPEHRELRRVEIDSPGEPVAEAAVGAQMVRPGAQRHVAESEAARRGTPMSPLPASGRPISEPRRSAILMRTSPGSSASSLARAENLPRSPGRKAAVFTFEAVMSRPRRRGGLEPELAPRGERARIAVEAQLVEHDPLAVRRGRWHAPAPPAAPRHARPPQAWRSTRPACPRASRARALVSTASDAGNFELHDVPGRRRLYPWPGNHIVERAGDGHRLGQMHDLHDLERSQVAADRPGARQRRLGEPPFAPCASIGNPGSNLDGAVGPQLESAEPTLQPVKLEARVVHRTGEMDAGHFLQLTHRS